MDLNRLTLKSQEALNNAQATAVSLDHLALAFIDEGDKSFAGKLFKEFNVTRDRFLKALTEVRGNQRVTSSDPEQTYEALERYGRDLVAEARRGKLDPVIGRDAE